MASPLWFAILTHRFELKRQAVALTLLHELTHEEIARVLQIALGTTKTRICSGLMKRRAELVCLAGASH
jgi:DNA-directed RNA polymerase specialized sigma24 family protein